MMFAMLFWQHLSAAATPRRNFWLHARQQGDQPALPRTLRRWYGDSVIIIQSLILDYCQDSNWAVNDLPMKVEFGTDRR